MGIGSSLIALVLAVIVPLYFVLMWLASGYQRLVALRTRYRSAYAQLDIQFKQRHGLITRLVDDAKGRSDKERGTLEAVVTAREQALAASVLAAKAPGDPSAMKELSSAEAALAEAMGRLLGPAGTDPQLKPNAPAKGLIEEAASMEGRIAGLSQAYNDAVASYNTVRTTFPGNLIAGCFGFSRAEPFVSAKTAAETAAGISIK